ncbi:hypothetical protein HKX23_09375 [Sulfitobacter sp. KE29]|uniref:hypothetical protein n=1 Tax=Sulfitobacter TaxID=60136 RepID=UPI0010AD3CBA|nr:MULTISPECIES: hypothetical protein [Sulfitobacter]MBO9437821.1 hypothetical protein [Sulfitobacter sp. R18_2]MDF3418868.1 hypothetical protein [Sulfitobacter sp. Ks38]MDF3426047.1 hypothetical protein [Sulfitobacter sp. KE29]MDF3429627.1 hypothetical protein [Sulfitobacter sp. S46]MDF3444703.1 hypothetical protein [Sulfitobacter sp. KE31]
MSDMTGLLAKHAKAGKRQITRERLGKMAAGTVSSEKKAILSGYANSCQSEMNHSRGFALVSQQQHGLTRDEEQQK